MEEKAVVRGLADAIIVTVAGGQVSEIRAVSDRLTMFAQLGREWPSA